ncbi:hypothetical protein [Xenorhabdus bovienii]|uniref:hypothetical protein n=1 Tax=Xenorhabdus bovienii TaxID=40576 RepID=UPI0023B3391B|nr:hypothetical protein [Xenorhabdus bovienii]MDE9544116.1 hypothetical protein [Xenorhabdus bovienii]
MNLIKLEKIVNFIFSVMGFVAIGLFITNKYLSISPIFFFAMYILAGLNIFLAIFNRKGKFNRILSIILAVTLIIGLGLSVFFFFV